jgi:hypothetical protein
MSHKAFPDFARLGGEIVNVKRFAYSDTKDWSLFNPSIGQSPQGYAIAFRSSNYVIMPETGELHVVTAGPIRNKVFFTETNDKLELLNLREITFEKSGIKIERGVEDAKLFWRDSKWHFTGIIVEREIPVPRVGLFILDPKTSTARLVKLYEGQNPKKPEKNWMAPYEKSKFFDYIHGPVSTVKGSQVIHNLSDNLKIAPLRGNTNLLTLEDGSYLAVVHILYTKAVRAYDARAFGMRDGLSKDYTHLFARYDERGTLIELSDEFKFISSGIEFAAGMVEMGDDLIITFGKEDVSSHYARINKKLALSMLKPVSPHTLVKGDGLQQGQPS